MKIYFSSQKGKKRQEDQIKIVEEAAKKHQEADLLLFGQAFLSGDQALSFDYKKDIWKASGLYSQEIIDLRKIAKENKSALGFGFYENQKGGIYHSYLIIDKEGESLFKHQALGRDWMEKGACADYRLGHSLGYFELKGKKISLLLGQDFFYDDCLLALCELDDLVDCFIWLAHKKDPRAKERSQILAKPIYYLTSQGVFLFKQGKLLERSSEGENFFRCQLG